MKDDAFARYLFYFYMGGFTAINVAVISLIIIFLNR